MSLRHVLLGAVALLLPLVTVIHAASPPQQVALEVDRLLKEEVLDKAVAKGEKLADRADDATFLRRASLDLIGELPTPGEITAFSFDPDPKKRQKLITRLLDSDLYGQNWARYWRDVIFYRRTEQRALLALPATQAYLTRHFNENTSWDQIAADFITAQGDGRTQGATGLIMAQQGRPEDTVSEISRIFLGIQIQCAQCHDHPTDRWKREQFHQLAAFFPRVAVRPSRSPLMRTLMVVADDRPAFRRRNANNRYRGTLEHYMPDLQDPSAEGTKMQPVLFVGGQKLPLGTPDAERRRKLAEWITSPENPWFAKALVNRVWAELVGEGFYDEVDDIGPDRDASAPKTLDRLAAAFTESGYDLKWLMRTITATEAYQRKSRSRRNYNESPFTASCAQRLRGDQLFNVLTTALGLTEQSSRGRGRGAYGFAQTPRGQFNFAFGYDPSTPREEVKGSIPQALALMNSPILNNAMSASRPGGLGKLLREIKDDEALIVELYLRCLAREPQAKEMAIAKEYLRQVDNRSEAFEDLLWALVNSTEFLHRR